MKLASFKSFADILEGTFYRLMTLNFPDAVKSSLWKGVMLIRVLLSISREEALMGQFVSGSEPKNKWKWMR